MRAARAEKLLGVFVSWWFERCFIYSFDCFLFYYCNKRPNARGFKPPAD